MYQVDAAIWNRIADEEVLESDWAQQMFPLPSEELDRALEKESARLRKAGHSSGVVVSYLTMLPLLLEREAIARFKSRNQGLEAALPNVESVEEAVLVAAKDRVLNANQKAELSRLLSRPPM